MRLIGLTGGIGSGKSSVSRMLASYGALIIDADQITHDLERRGQAVWKAIHAQFGWPVLQSDGEIDRKKLGSWVFGVPALRERLNAIVHPAVRAEIRRRAEVAAHDGVSVAVLDVPLLIEGGLYRLADEVWVVYADPADQAARIQARDGLGAASAWQRIRAQMPLKEKLAYADHVIDNRGGMDHLEMQVRELWQNVAAGA